MTSRSRSISRGSREAGAVDIVNVLLSTGQINAVQWKLMSALPVTATGVISLSAQFAS
ncbi:hypothetical protein [Burkholderia sp. PAMC 26561]|uniref:Uncharacterized protein n=1 Tax=Caballeronia sordidicola TaxID=196367 RepID=A0A242M8W8_CABSO|nr:hypothetical protein [Burkholderia sp. PAMC 26561]OTP67708.1 hypothetical protein PAMC26577_36005 [Caballeronia sordidicola]